MNALADFFSDTYLEARARFVDAATAAGATLQAHAVGGAGPDGAPLTLDVASLGDARAPRVVVVSSGTHGVEGFFGSAVQCAWLAKPVVPSGVRMILVHAMNPYGFAYLRRVNEDNVDLNRNFMRREEAYAGVDPGYEKLAGLLNPTTPPRRFEPFIPIALWNIVRFGFATLKNSVVQGQYAHPRGLFFGGRGPSATLERLRSEVPNWSAGRERVVHLDLHTGMGRWGTHVLAVADRVDSERVALLRQHFTASRIEALDPSGVLYEIRGVLGAWLAEQAAPVPYHCLLAEFGTYAPLRVLRALREENRAHHVLDAADPRTVRAKAELKEVFAPRDVAWRHLCVTTAVELIAAAQATAAS